MQKVRGTIRIAIAVLCGDYLTRSSSRESA